MITRNIQNRFLILPFVAFALLPQSIKAIPVSPATVNLRTASD